MALRISQIAICCSFAIAIPLAAADQAPLAPTGKWLVEYGKDQCLLSRQYGTDRKPLILTFERLPMTDTTGIFVLTRNGRSPTEAGDANIGLPGGRYPNQRYNAFANNGGVRIVSSDIEAPILGPVQVSERIAVQAGKEVDSIFAVPNLTAALKALDACTIDLGRAWGFTVEQQKAIKTSAKPVQKLATLFSSADYPFEALRNGEFGRAKVRISIDISGKPTECSLTRSSGSKTIDEKTCRVLMKKGRFNPAMGADGKPLPSLYITSATWLIAG